MTMPCRQSLFIIALLMSLLAAPRLRAADPATVSFRKVFKSSNPEFVEIRVREDGAATCDIRSLSESPDPQPFEVGVPLTAKIFELSAQLNHFRDLQLDTRRRIANLGEKTFRYERGSEAGEVKFNYTIDASANQLLMIFEGLTRQQDHIHTLLHRMKYDRLGVNNALLNFENDLDHKMIPEPERLLPVLQQIAADSRFVDIARQRARSLIDRIRNPK
jgi:hypothetical protein